MVRKSQAWPGFRDWSRFIIQYTPSGVITTDSQGCITEFNPAAEHLSGYGRDEALGRPFQEVLHCEGGGQDLLLVLTGRKEVTLELTLCSRSGPRVPVLLSSFALKDARGVLRGGVLILRDLSPIKRREQERRHLVDMFAHDLRAPVVGMAGLVRRLRQGKLGPLSPAQLAYLETIAGEMGRVEELINRFLEFAHLDLRLLTPVPEAIQVKQACREVITLLSPLAEAKGMTLETRVPGEMPVLRADPWLFRGILQNLLENAIKYATPRTPVVLEAQVMGPEVRFAVQDQGPGISPQDLPHLFEFFYRGREVGRERGFGLGLATVKCIIDAHGGRIWLDTAAGRGTTFFFTFPLEIPQHLTSPEDAG